MGHCSHSHYYITGHSFRCPLIYIVHVAVQSSRQTLFTLPAIIVNLTVQSSHYYQRMPLGCPIIKRETTHITSNNRYFGCPIIYIFCYFVPLIMHNTVVDPGFLRGTNFRGRCTNSRGRCTNSRGRCTNSRGRCTNLSFCKIFEDNCMKMKDFEPRGGAPSLDPLVLYKPSHSPTRMHSSRKRTTRSSSRWEGGQPVPPQLPPWVWAWTRFPSTSQALPKKLHEIE